MKKDSQKDFQELKPGDEIILDDFNDNEQQSKEPMVSVHSPKPPVQPTPKTEPPPVDAKQPLKPSAFDDSKSKVSEPISIEDELAVSEMQTIIEPQPSNLDLKQPPPQPPSDKKYSDLPLKSDKFSKRESSTPALKESAEPALPLEKKEDKPVGLPPEKPLPATQSDIKSLTDQSAEITAQDEKTSSAVNIEVSTPSLDSSPLAPKPTPGALDYPQDTSPKPEVNPLQTPSQSPVTPEESPILSQSIDPILPTIPFENKAESQPVISPSVKSPDSQASSQSNITTDKTLPPDSLSQAQTASTPPAQVLAPTPPMPTSPNAAFEADLDKLIKPPPQVEDKQGSKPIQNIPKVSRTFMAFCFLTCCIFLGTITFLLIKFWPNINNVFTNQNQQEISQFEDVLAHLLQVKNQNVEISFVSEEDQDILPHIEDDNIILAEINMTNDVQLAYFDEDFIPHFNANLDFDLQLQGSNSSNNILLAFSTLFQDEEAYFKINKFCIDDCSGLHLDDQYLQRWSNLRLLLQSGQTDGGLSENKSRIFSYLVTLFNEYPTYRYLVLLPVFNIVSSQQYIEAKNLLMSSQIYNLNSDGCQQIKAQEMRCPLTINYTNLYNFYQQVYADILRKPLPSYYVVLENLQLPNEFEIVFDTKEHAPILLTAVSDSFDLNIGYSKFDSISFNLESPTSFVSLQEYYQQILKAEEQIYIQ